MIVYILLLATIGIVYAICVKNGLTERRKKIFLIVSWIILVVVLGSRHNWYSFNDEGGYYRVYEAQIKMSFDSFVRIFSGERDVGYYFLSWIFSQIIPWPQFIIYATTAVSIGAVFYLIYYTCDYPFMAICIYFGCGLLVFEMSAFRQAMAMSLGCIALIKILQGRKIVPIILVAISMTMHMSAIVLFALLVIPRKNNNLLNRLAVIVAVLLGGFSLSKIMVFGNDLLGKDYGLGGEFSLTGFLIQLIIIAFPMVLFLFKFDRTNKDTIRAVPSQNDFIENISLLNFGFYLMRIFSLVLERLSYFFLPNVIVQYDRLIGQFKSKDRMLVKMVISMLMIMLFLYRMNKGIRGGVFTFFWQ